MESKYLDQIRNITAEDDVERAKKIADIVMSTNESISATPTFAKEVRTIKKGRAGYVLITAPKEAKT